MGIPALGAPHPAHTGSRWARLTGAGCVVASLVVGPSLAGPFGGLASGAASGVGRPAGTKAAPYLPTTALGATTTSLVVAPGRIVIDGKGFGHGVGLAQDGAYWMGKAGKSVGQILSLFFPGTTLSKRSGVVRVPLASLGSMTVLLPSGGSAGGIAVPPGGTVRALAGAGVVSVNLAGAKVPPASSEADSATTIAVAFTPSTVADIGAQLGFSGRFGLSPGEPIPADPSLPVSAPSTIPPATEPSTSLPASNLPASSLPVTGLTSASGDADTIQTRPGIVAATAPVVKVTAASGGVIVVGAKQYRGTLEFIGKSQGMKVVNELDVEQYLRGMAEVTDPRWPAAALQAQAVVARTYALRMMGTRGEVCPTQACQVYVGAQAEYPVMDAAIAATAGKVVVYKGELANTFYSASGGGTIADPSEVFGVGTPIPYLQAGTYPTGDPKAWRVELSIVELGRRVGYPGALYDVVVSKVGPSGRAVEVTFVGSSGARSMNGPTFDRILGLRSTNFRLVVGRSDPSATTVPITGNVVALDVGQLEESPLDFQSGLFGEPILSTALPDGATETTTLPASTAPEVDQSVSTLSSSASTSLRSAPSHRVPPEPTVEMPGEVVQSATSLSADSESQTGRLATMMVGGLATLIGMAWALKWALGPEGHGHRRTGS